MNVEARANIDGPEAPPLEAETDALRAAYAALNRNDISAFAQVFDPQIERIEPPEFPRGGTYHGLEAVKAHISQGRSTWAEGSCEPERFIVAGDKVVVSLHIHVRLKDHTDWIEGRIADVFTFRDGKAIQFRSFADESEALEFAGATTLDMAITSSTRNDFDFVIGDWAVKHRRLKERLVGCDEWVEFDGTMSTRKILGGCGNIEDNFLDLPGDAYRAIALRSFDPAINQWSIWWLDGRDPTRLDVPVVGGFADGKGLFFANDQLGGKPIKVRFTWFASRTEPRWEQAFSGDDGDTWETNWTMDFYRAGPGD